MKVYILKEWKFIAVITMLHAVWYIVSYYYGNMITGDSMEYLLQANNIKENGSLYAWYWNQPIDYDYHTWRPPVYGYFIYLCQFIFESPYFFLALQNIFSIGIFILTHIQLSRFSQSFNPRPWLVAGALFFPSLFISANTVMADTMFVFFVLVAFTYMQSYLSNDKTKDFVYYQLVLLLALFTKPVLLFFWLPNLVISIFLFLKYRKAVLLWLPLVFPLVIAGWSYRNYTITGVWHFSSVTHINMILHNAKAPLMQKYGYEYAEQYTKDIFAEGKTKASYAERVAYTNDRAYEIIKQYPLEYIYAHIKGSTLLLYMEPGRSDWLPFFKIPMQDQGSISLAFDLHGWKGLWDYAQKISWIILLAMILSSIWNVGLIIAMLAGVKKFWREPYVQFLLLYMVYITVLTGVVGCSRYRLGLYPFMLLIGFLGMHSLKLTRRKI